jgi:hypothetical protein
MSARASIPVSIVLHAAVIGATLVAWNFAPPTPPTPPSIPISMVQIGPETNLRAATALDVPDAEISPTPPQNADGEPTPGDEMGQQDSTNLKAPPPSKAVSDVPSLNKPVKPEDKPSPTTKSKDKSTDPKVKKGQEFDFDRMINKATQKYSAASRNEQPTNAQQAEIGNKAFGEANKMAASATDALREQMKRCWRAPVDQANPERLIVTVKVFLNRDGSVQKAPTLIRPNPLPVGDRGMVLAWESAKRAILSCAPYDLPEESYEIWNDLTLRFDPREMQ